MKVPLLMSSLCIVGANVVAGFDYLEVHRVFRAKHVGIAGDDLSYSTKAAHKAQKLAYKCSADIDPQQYKVTVSVNYADRQKAIENMYAQSRGYDFAHPGPQEGTENFVQMIWRESAFVGCGEAVCKDSGKEINDGNLLVCLYSHGPSQHTPEEYLRNVLPAIEGPQSRYRRARVPLID